MGHPTFGWENYGKTHISFGKCHVPLGKPTGFASSIGKGQKAKVRLPKALLVLDLGRLMRVNQKTPGRFVGILMATLGFNGDFMAVDRV